MLKFNSELSNPAAKNVKARHRFATLFLLQCKTDVLCSFVPLVTKKLISNIQTFKNKSPETNVLVQALVLNSTMVPRTDRIDSTDSLEPFVKDRVDKIVDKLRHPSISRKTSTWEITKKCKKNCIFLITLWINYYFCKLLLIKKIFIYQHFRV